MKTFKQLLPEDKVYRVEGNSIKYKAFTVLKVTPSKVELSDYKELERTNAAYKSLGGSESLYNSSPSRTYFVNESDAMRYCKTRVLKELRARIKEAKFRIDRVKELRKQYWKELNHQWIDEEIVKLDKELV